MRTVEYLLFFNLHTYVYPKITINESGWGIAWKYLL